MELGPPQPAAGPMPLTETALRRESSSHTHLAGVGARCQPPGRRRGFCTKAAFYSACLLGAYAVLETYASFLVFAARAVAASEPPGSAPRRRPALPHGGSLLPSRVVCLRDRAVYRLTPRRRASD